MRGRAIAACVAVTLACAAAAGAQTGVQVAPDGKSNLVSKDVGDERWAIHYDLSDGTVTGNVFFPDGRDPLFVWCEERARGDQQVTIGCWGADRCNNAPCSSTEWSFIREVVLPLQFFYPPGAFEPPQPTSTPNPVSTPSILPTAPSGIGGTLNSMVGIWQFTIGATTRQFRLVRVQTTTSGVTTLVGLGPAGHVAVAPPRQLAPGRGLRFDFALLEHDDDVAFCRLWVFNRTSETTVVGNQFRYAAGEGGSCFPTNLPGNEAFTGVRITTDHATAPAAASVDIDPADLAALVEALEPALH